MLKKIVLITLIMSVMVAGFAAAEFRGVEWGSQRGTITYHEGTDYEVIPLAFDGSLVRIDYNRQVIPGVPSKVMFVLEDKTLTRGFITFPANAKDRVLGAIDSKYGERVDLSEHPSDEIRNDYDGIAWETDDTYIIGMDSQGFALYYVHRDLFDVNAEIDSSGF